MNAIPNDLLGRDPDELAAALIVAYDNQIDAHQAAIEDLRAKRDRLLDALDATTPRSALAPAEFDPDKARDAAARLAYPVEGQQRHEHASFAAKHQTAPARPRLKFSVDQAAAALAEMGAA